ncbi:hypothetical protein B0H10DRAFT_1956739 [Mycena sp. CBHHK59/15]|nr:hypothetical protein B0H10DRAFT_1956739 [Mycena sp. CBHHK59/15]
MLKSVHHPSSACHLVVLRYILTHMVDAIALNVADWDVCNQVNSGMEGGWRPQLMATAHQLAVLEGLAQHGDVSHMNRLDAVQGVPGRMCPVGSAQRLWLNDTTCEHKSVPTVGEGPYVGLRSVSSMKQARVGGTDPSQASHKRFDEAGELQRMRWQHCSSNHQLPVQTRQVEGSHRCMGAGE